MERETSFAHWVKQRRKALDLTQDDLAQLVRCAIVTIQKIEEGRRRPSKQVAELLSRHLAIPSEERELFLRLARAEAPVPRIAPAPQSAEPQPASQLPTPLTPLIGRAVEVAAIWRYLERPDVRLVTLVGPPGVGKTRLSIQVAGEVGGEFPDGVWFVALAAIRDPALVLPEIAHALGIADLGSQPVLQRLQTMLRAKRALLVLDNFEQIVDAAPLVAELLVACSQLKVLATSRVRLQVYGEHEYGVEPFRVPDRTAVVAPEQLIEYEAMRLFVARAQAFMPSFALTPDNARAIVEICARLDGLPLAIELAAARIRQFTPQTLAADLGTQGSNPLPLLGCGPRDLPARQQTLQNAIAWSYALLDSSAQQAFRRLGVFMAGCTIEAAEAVGIAERGVNRARGQLQMLVDHSLLRHGEGPAGTSRFLMLETIREYALEQLQSSGEAEALRQRHTRYFLALAEQGSQALHGPLQVVWNERLDHEHDNMRAALAWSLEHDQLATTLDLAAALAIFWERRGYLREGIAWLARILERMPEASLGRAKALIWIGRLSHEQGNATESHAFLSEALAIGTRLGDTRTIADARLGLLFSFAEERRYTEEKRALCRDLIGMYKALGDDHGEITVLDYLGEIARRAGAYGQAEAYVRDGLALAERAGDVGGAADAFYQLARLAHARGDLAGAGDFMEQSYTLYAKIGARLPLVRRLISLGEIARHSGDNRRAEDFYHQGLALLQPFEGEHLVATVFLNFGHIAVAEGNLSTAAEHYVTSLEAFTHLGDSEGVIWCLESATTIGARSGRAEEAAQLLGASVALRSAYGIPPEPADSFDLNRISAQVRTACPAAVFTTAWEAGQSMDLTAATQLARALLVAGRTPAQDNSDSA